MKATTILIILAILLVTGGPYFIFGILPDLKAGGAHTVAQRNRIYLCDGQAIAETKARAGEIIASWASSIEAADLGYQIGNVDLFAAEQYIVSQCSVAQDDVQRAADVDVSGSLYDELNQYKISAMSTSASRQDAVLGQASVCLSTLVSIKEYEMSQTENSFSQHAKLYARSSMWEFCQFYGQQAVAAYSANQSTPGP